MYRLRIILFYGEDLKKALFIITLCAIGLAFADEESWHVRFGLYTDDSLYFDDHNKAGVIVGASMEKDIYDTEKFYPPTSRYAIMFFPHLDPTEPDYWAPPYNKDYTFDYRPPLTVKETWYMKFAMVYSVTQTVTVWWSEIQDLPPSYLTVLISQDEDTFNLFEQNEFTQDFPPGIHRWRLSVTLDYYTRYNISPSEVTLYTGETAEFGFYLHHLDDSIRCQSAQYDYSGSGGSIDSFGIFHATSPGGGIVIASQGGYADTAEVTIIPGSGNYIPLQVGWNMISLPCNPASNLVSDVLPGYLGNIYKFINSTGNYVDADSVEPGIGYFVLSTRDTVLDIAGSALDSISVPVFTGWNMVGGPGDWAVIGNFVSSPTGIVHSLPWVWSHGYEEVDSVGPSQGFWILCNSDGILKIISD